MQIIVIAIIGVIVIMLLDSLLDILGVLKDIAVPVLIALLLVAVAIRVLGSIFGRR